MNICPVSCKKILVNKMSPSTFYVLANLLSDLWPFTILRPSMAVHMLGQIFEIGRHSLGNKNGPSKCLTTQVRCKAFSFMAAFKTGFYCFVIKLTTDHAFFVLCCKFWLCLPLACHVIFVTVGYLLCFILLCSSWSDWWRALSATDQLFFAAGAHLDQYFAIGH